MTAPSENARRPGIPARCHLQARCGKKPPVSDISYITGGVCYDCESKCVFSAALHTMAPVQSACIDIHTHNDFSTLKMQPVGETSMISDG